ncbi:hypothetical protein [Marinobacter sp.]|uniref:hypothetical protein n=1 Tax=Marinobacter sp. TaxID=50741 RepID=UPI00384C7E00
MLSELDLDRAFADKLSSSDEFCSWVLGKTKFKNVSGDATLLHREQAKAKPRKKPENWWRHWWCRLQDGSESETDIFAVFGLTSSQERVALHIENKPPKGKFTPHQHLNYSRRAEFMANKSQYLNYSAFTTILVAPKAFMDANDEEVTYFECLITYEAIGEFIPQFARSLAEARTKD